MPALATPAREASVILPTRVAVGVWAATTPAKTRNGNAANLVRMSTLLNHSLLFGRLHQLNPVSIRIVELRHIFSVAENMSLDLAIIRGRRFGPEHRRDLRHVGHRQADVILDVEPVGRGRFPLEPELESIGSVADSPLTVVPLAGKAERVAIILRSGVFVPDQNAQVIDVG